MGEYFADAHASFAAKIIRFIIFCVFFPLLAFPPAFTLLKNFMSCNTRELRDSGLGHCGMNLNLPGTENYIDPSFFSMIQKASQTYLEIFSGGPFQTGFVIIWITLIILYTITKRVDEREDEIISTLLLSTISNRQRLWENRLRAILYPLFGGVFLSFGPTSYYFVKNYTSMNNFNASVVIFSFTLVSFGIFVSPFLGAFMFKYLK